MKKNSKTVILILKSLGIFILTIILSFVMFFSITNLLENLNVISLNLAIISTLIITLLSSIIFTILYIVKKTKTNKNIFPNTAKWFKYYILFMIVIGATNSFKATLEIDIEKASELISFEWTLFAFLIGLLVTWCVIVEKEIKANSCKGIYGVDKRVKKVIEDYRIHAIAKGYFWNLIPSAIALLSLTSITTLILINQQFNLIIQGFLYFSLNMIINSIILIVYDIITPIFAKLYVLNKKEINEKAFENEIVTGVIEDKILTEIDETLKKHPKFKIIPEETQEEMKSNMFIKLQPEMENIKNEILKINKEEKKDDTKD